MIRARGITELRCRSTLPANLLGQTFTMSAWIDR
jgi:hypothetical protein